MKTVTKYIADDGKEFLDQEECKIYEKNKWFIDLWEGLEDNYRELGFANGACFLINIENGAEVLAFLSKHCIITKKPEAFSAKKVLNKSKNN